MRKLILAAAAAAALSGVATPALAQANPSPAETEAARKGPCRDPWVKIALDATYGPQKWGKALCSIKLYNNGQWNSYADLLGYVRGVKLANDAERLILAIAPNVPNQIFIVVGGIIKAALPAALIGNDVAGLVGNDGASKPESGLISNVPGGLISNVAASVVTGLPVANFGPPSPYSLQDASKTKVRYGPNMLSVPK